MRVISNIVEIMKATRREPATRRQIAELIGSKPETVGLYTDEMVAQGLLTECVGERPGRHGRAPAAYRLADAWKGAEE